MFNYKDKLGRRLNVGDIIVCSDSYYRDVFVGKITGITHKAVSFKLFEGARDEGWGNSPLNPLQIESFLQEPTGWHRWTKMPEKKLLILRKRQKT